MQSLSQFVWRYTRFSGRAGIAEYFTVLFLTMGAIGVLGAWLGLQYVLIFGIPGSHMLLVGGSGAGAMLLTLLIYIPFLAALSRRLHDQDRPFWIVPLMLVVVALLGWLTLVVVIISLNGLACAPGTPGPNRFGPDPRQQPGSPATA